MLLGLVVTTHLTSTSAITWHSTLHLKNELTLASCSFVTQGLILIILDKQHQHAFKNYMHIQLSLSLHFYLLYLLLNSSDRNDATPAT